VLQAIWDVYNKGGVIGGSSAGAAIMSSTMYYDAKTVLGTLAAGVNDGKELAPGLGFVGTDLFVDQHLLARGRFARMLPAMLKKNYKLGWASTKTRRWSSTASAMSKSSATRALAAGSAPGDQWRDQGIQPVNARISYLDRGDRYNLVTGQYTPSADKAQGKLDPAQPFLNEQVYGRYPGPQHGAGDDGAPD
jgi:cyanophycinase